MSTTTTASQLQTRTFRVEGMTCTSCAARVQATLEDLPEVASAVVDKATDTATIHLAIPAANTYLNKAIGERYTLSAAGTTAAGKTAGGTSAAGSIAEGSPSFTTYRPLLTVVGFILLVTLLAQYPYPAGFDGSLWMRHFMAGFFITFSFFKLLNVSGFAESYRMYDEIAKRVPAWGNIYPFVELGLGLAYLTNIAPVWTNVATIVVLGVSAVGVIRSVLDKRAIKCACLGDVFNLPMSTVTIVEDVTMVAMAAWMLLV